MTDPLTTFRLLPPTWSSPASNLDDNNQSHQAAAAMYSLPLPHPRTIVARPVALLSVTAAGPRSLD